MRTMSTIFRLICVRHGETKANKEQRIQGHLDIPLNDVGEAQSKKAGMALKDVHFNRAYSSDLMRAKATRDLIILNNNAAIDIVLTDKRIRERFFGIDEGKLFREVTEEIKQTNQSWQSYNPPDSETVSDVQIRCVDFFKDLCQSVYDKAKVKESIFDGDFNMNLQEVVPNESVLLVSHGLALKQLFKHFSKVLECENFPTADFDNQLSPNTGISEFVVQFSPRKYRMKCLRFHDATHFNS